MKTEYYTTVNQFYGFYDTVYYSCDMENDYNEKMEGCGKLIPQGKHYELTKFDEYRTDLCKEWVDIVKGQLEFATGNVIRSIKYKRLSSPRFYNFETDKLVMVVDFRINALKRWCFITKPDKFNEYLNEHYSSRSGFCSFIPNCIGEFKQKYYKEYKTNKEREYNNLFNVMLEFYLECQVDFETDVNDNIVYWIEDELSNYMDLVNDTHYDDDNDD